MALVHRTYSARRGDTRTITSNEASTRVSPLVILQARFQQKQLQEKEEKLLKLYEEQQERALKSVGSRSLSGGSSVSSSSSVGGGGGGGAGGGGGGKVRHMFQSRRGNSDSRLGVAITGRDKSYPLEPLLAQRNDHHPSASRRYGTSNWENSTQHRRTVSLDRGHPAGNGNYYELDENYNYQETRRRRRGRGGGGREEDEEEGVQERSRAQSQVRDIKAKKSVLYFGGSREDFRYTDELDYGQSFQVVDDHYEQCDTGYRKRVTEPFNNNNNNNNTDENNSYASDFNDKRRFYERNANYTSVYTKAFPVRNNESQDEMEGRYKSYVSQNAFAKKPHLGNGTLAGSRTGTTTIRQTAEIKESTTHTSGYVNGAVSSPVRKIRKPTPVPLSVAPPQHLLQKEGRKTTTTTTRAESIREVPSSISSIRAPASRTQSTSSGRISVSLQKPPTPTRSSPSTRISSSKAGGQPSAPTSRSTAPPSDLVGCRICGRHFAADRVSKHEEICQKSSKSKRKPFDALQQRVKGTEVEKYVRKSGGKTTARAQPEKIAKPQSNWRKKHEEFINNIRAAKEVSAHLKKGGKLSDLPPPPPSDYSDYIQCPHCSRKFNSSAAERHIPKCANIINNKPKPGLQQKNTGLKQGSKILHATTTSARGRK